MNQLDGMVAIVTGASRGIGRGAATELARRGAKVVIAARTMSTADLPQLDGDGVTIPGALEEVVEAIEKEGGEATPIRCDLAHDEQILELVARAKDRYGRIDVLINNGMPQETMTGRFWELPLSTYDNQMTIGPRAYYAAARHCAPIMIEQGKGLIVNISSPGACVDFYSAAYCIGRAASDRMAQALSEDISPHGVTVVSLWPAFVRTERVMMAHTQKNAGFDVPDDFDPDTHANSPEIVGTAVAHLANDPDSIKLTGKMLTVRELAAHYGFSDVDGKPAAANAAVEYLEKEVGCVMPLAYVKPTLTTK